MVNKNNFGKNFIFAVLIFCLFSYSWIFQLIPILLFNLNIEKLSSKTGVLLNAFASLCLGITLFFIFRKSIIKEFKTFKCKFWDNFDIGVRYWFFGLSAMIVFNLLITCIFSGKQAGNEEAVQSMISSLPWMMIINAGFLAPWCEELVFRKSIKNLFNNKWFYLITSGLLFGLAHVVGNTNSWVDWLYILPYGSLGCAFAASYYDTDTIFTPLLFHVVHNVILVIISII